MVDLLEIEINALDGLCGVRTHPYAPGSRCRCARASASAGTVLPAAAMSPLQSVVASGQQ